MEWRRPCTKQYSMKIVNPAVVTHKNRTTHRYSISRSVFWLMAFFAKRVCSIAGNDSHLTCSVKLPNDIDKSKIYNAEGYKCFIVAASSAMSCKYSIKYKSW